MDRSMEQTLIECLEALDRGEAIGQILSRYPDEAAELRPYLEAAARLTTLKLQPTVEAQAKSRKRFLAQAEASKEVSPLQPRRPLSSLFLRSLATMALIVIIGVGFINMAANALPGDTLYGAKLFIEQAQLGLSGNGRLEERFRQNRILEIENLLRQNREANVAFSGVIDGIEGDTWRIEGLLVATAAANLNGEPEVGDLVNVEGWVANGRLVANEITVSVKNETPATPQPTESRTATATAKPTESATPDVSVTETAVSTVTVSSSPTNTMQPTPTATTAATNIPTSTPLPNPDPVPSPDPVPTHDDDGSDDNSGSGSESEEEDSSGSGSSNSGSGSSNSGSGGGDDNSGSGGEEEEDNSGSGSSNSGSSSDDDGE